ncbi:PREDICTED: probable sodium/metabolite cotransporter BASS1, chloroplastic [Prunus mume]|uniref:Probable sodium/metabolite cotransporter BASS1, chloroplastic n=1 Tax=Prunus mume TaxID=102107 RepID=A0ABM1LMM8_PRUMU|nr:PREDICTED: probable sodium/metabolite cotransporter BASS1, chloroplastic [Prunus mume]XP_016648649.1 PREDICTED: probable sodium/metabolite cotransporter BASS1, chloroplastic [Prunus mume]XP_016648650.1 PREDICTED: probable sodium/metabolite cotransporter BASS1, chloroplastic [Prunus mume]XP_016648651.1 PREDICTED: probable sodium/metabolite cotransporter BASS1, chloroplastic [Prunus mume]XP_016648652.1 PREDICTED: probable sodium/metabolite cotransporter BASS1, chloroplastic [Prunus mume]XP_01
MPSSLSHPHGNTGFKFQSNPISNQSPLTAISFPFAHYTKTSPYPSAFIQLTLRSQYDLRPQFPSKPTWLLPSVSFPPTLATKTGRSSLAPLQCGILSNSCSANDGKRSFRDWVEVVGEAVSTAFPIWVALGCLLGLIKPSSFNWVTPNLTILGITLTMLGMGMTLTFDDLRGALAMPKELLAGFVLQYSVMPLSGYAVSMLLNLPSYYAAGLILVGCCPGGTASNIVTYIARGNVALSVLMTAASTLSAVIMTPFLTAKLAGQYVAVDAAGLLFSTLQVVLLPVLAGAFLNQYFQGLVKFVSPLMPPIAVATVAVLCGNAIAQSSSAILMSGKQVVLAAALLHASGFFFGYVLSRILGIDVSSSRTISIEVGMQNSVLGVVLASQHFGNPLTAVPCAVSSVCHSILGSALAGIWRQSVPTQKQD